MKPALPFSRRAARTAGFTLPEALIAMTLFALLVLGIIGANLFGLRWYQIGQTKLLATDSARESIGKMGDELRNCCNATVGNVSNGVFLAHVDGETQTGNGLMIYATTNTNNYVIYFLNAGDQTFRRFVNPAGTTNIIAQSVTNANIFSVQDYLGNVLTNNQNNRLIRCSLEFYAAPPKSPVADYYRIDTAVAPRAWN